MFARPHARARADFRALYSFHNDLFTKRGENCCFTTLRQLEAVNCLLAYIFIDGFLLLLLIINKLLLPNEKKKTSVA